MIKEVFPQAKKVFDSLNDEQSKKIFALRMMFNLTNDYNYLIDMTSLIPGIDSNKMQSFKDYYNQYKAISDQYPTRKLIIYGAGAVGKGLLELFREINWYSFCDKDPKKQGTFYCGLPVISPEQLIQDHKDDYIVIASRDFYEEIYEELTSMAIPKNHILNGNIKFRLEVFDDKQYFEAPIIEPQENEVFVDAGCFNCDTTLLFK